MMLDNLEAGKQGSFHFSNRGFTLVELLISILLIMIITGTVVSMLFLYVIHFEQTEEITAARQRGEMVIAILEGPILHAGMGMPNSADLFDSAFSIGAGAVPFNGWNGPVDLVDNEYPGDEIRVVYAEPTASIVESADNGSDMIYFNSGADLSRFQAGNGSNLRNWAVFPSLESPYRITAKGGDSLSVTASEDVDQIALFDNLCCLRCMHAYVDDPGGAIPVFVINDMGGSGAQPIVDGIGGIHFDWNGSNHTLTVSVLALGSKRHGEEINPGDVPLWDEDNWEWDDDYRHYRLVVLNDRWRVRN